jgi:selenocysteine-specific elongation factor
MFALGSPLAPASTPLPALIVGTAGHIDHGKSSLVQALTGTDPDRLLEEKRRGITIELGFARLDLPDGHVMGIVDVPGHERFVRQMIAGASGIDIALLVIAADDGVMPQTEEHLSVLRMLAVPNCVVALTKIDRAEPEWIGLVAEDIRQLLAPTPYASAPIIRVSSRTGEGLPSLIRSFSDAARHVRPVRHSSFMRLPVDRSFSIRGAGTVVTGTLWDGQVAHDDMVEIVPSKTLARVRSVQVHGESTQVAQAGMRVALNLSGVKPEEVLPGSFLATKQTLTTTHRLNVLLTYLGSPFSDKPLKSGVRVHVAHGTREVLGRVVLMDGLGHCEASSTSLAQLRLEEPLTPLPSDRFVLRSYSPVAVIGGGIILDTLPRRRTMLKPDERELLEARRDHDNLTIVRKTLALKAQPGTLADIAAWTALPAEEVAPVLAHLDLCELKRNDSVYLAPRQFIDSAISRIENTLLSFHAANPLARGMSVAGLKHQCARNMGDNAFAVLIAEAVRRGVILAGVGEVSHAQAGAAARDRERETARRIETLLCEQECTPPAVADMAKLLGIDRSLAHKGLNSLDAEGKIVRVSTEFVFAAHAFARLREAVETQLRTSTSATAAELRDAMGVSRKYAIPLLEYLDRMGVTKRTGELRSLL